MVAVVELDSYCEAVAVAAEDLDLGLEQALEHWLTS